MYGTTEKKITHIIKDNHDNGLCGFLITICGKWIHPQSVTDERPEEGRMCKQCAKKEAAHDKHPSDPRRNRHP